MSEIDWAQRVAEGHIQRQFEVADALDAKAGILFAYSGAVIATGGALIHSGAEAATILTLAAAATGLAATVFGLWPQTYQDPPDPAKLESVIRAKTPTAEIVHALLDQQLEAVKSNDVLLGKKAWALRIAIIADVASTVLLGVEIAQGRGA